MVSEGLCVDPKKGGPSEVIGTRDRYAQVIPNRLPGVGPSRHVPYRLIARFSQVERPRAAGGEGAAQRG
jgi:hypothetical protein